MIRLSEALPSPFLQPYIKSFSLREFDTAEQEIKIPLHAIHKLYMSFFLNEKLPVLYSTGDNIDEKFIYGLHTFSRGIAFHSKEYFRVFCIVFQPNGFYKLFAIPPSDFIDTILCGSDLFSGNINRLQLQLQEAATLRQMIHDTEHFLFSYLSKSMAKDPHNSIQSASHFLLQYSGNISIKWLAYQSNMSIKTFERVFTTQIGIAPKLFGRIARFNAALNLKSKDEKKNWTSIAHQCGYFDQIHFIKDFKAFAGEAPSRFFKISPPPKESFEQSEGIT